MMACLSVILIFMPKDWMSRHWEFIPTQYAASLSDDKYSGGNSNVSWLDQEQQLWKCELAGQYRNPYCSMLLDTLSDTWSGLDLRDYSQMTIWGSYEGNAEFVRIYFRNRHANYYVVGDPTSTKYNMVEIPVAELRNGITVNLKDFSVADWWLAHRKIALKDSHPEFNDIIYVEVQTGSQASGGIHKIQLKKITFRGNLISDENLYKGVVLLWSVLIFLLLLFRFIRLKLELNSNRSYQQELISINSFLNLQNKQFEDLAKTDQLTGLLNRIGIRDALYDGLSDFKRSGTLMSFILCDIDHFKRINDSYGHDVGDQILKSVAELFKNNSRSSDFLARWGGEEFILVCPNTDLQQAQVVAELLRKKLDASELHQEEKITASFGVATIAKPDLDGLFRSADLALYEAKDAGRNQVVCKVQEV